MPSAAWTRPMTASTIQGRSWNCGWRRSSRVCPLLLLLCLFPRMCALPLPLLLFRLRRRRGRTDRKTCGRRRRRGFRKGLTAIVGEELDSAETSSWPPHPCGGGPPSAGARTGEGTKSPPPPPPGSLLRRRRRKKGAEGEASSEGGGPLISPLYLRQESLLWHCLPRPVRISLVQIRGTLFHMKCPIPR